MTYRLLVTYGRPTDPAAFDAYYRDTHTPLALQMPGIRRFTVGRPQSLDPRQEAPYQVVEIDFDSAEALQEALGSAPGRAAGADLATFASGGVTLVHYDVTEVDMPVPQVP